MLANKLRRQSNHVGARAPRPHFGCAACSTSQPLHARRIGRGTGFSPTIQTLLPNVSHFVAEPFANGLAPIGGRLGEHNRSLDIVI
jgi:hypothetical protein